MKKFLGKWNEQQGREGEQENWKRTADGINWKRLRAAFLATIQEFLAVINGEQAARSFYLFPSVSQARRISAIKSSRHYNNTENILDLWPSVNYDKPETTAVRRANSELAIRFDIGRSIGEKENLPAQSDA